MYWINKLHISRAYGLPSGRKMSLFFNLCIPCSLQIAGRNQLCLRLRMVLFYILTSRVVGIALLPYSKWCFSLSATPNSKKHCLLFYGVLLTACIFPLASDTFSVHYYNTVIFLCLSVLLGLHRGWLHNPSGIKLVIDLILQFISVAQITLQMTLYTSWN